MKKENILLKVFILLLCFIEFSQSEEVLSDNKIQGRLNIVNGASAECVMHQFYTKNGWIQVEGEIGRQGIDGLYYKKKNKAIREVLVAESKWNTSKLGRSGKNRAVKQMSQEWIVRTMQKLIKKNPSMPYDTLKKFIDNNQYRARLFRLKPIYSSHIQISIYKIKNKGFKSFDEIIESRLKSIDINNPKNNFEIKILTSFNNCRDKYLHKYFPMLTDENIKILLKDNYIQKIDVKQILN